MFSEYIGEKFQIQFEPSCVITLELIEVTPFSAKGTRPRWGADSDLEPQREPFSILFRGPQDFPLAQQMYTIEHEKMGTLEGPFLVPVGIDERGRYYESIFN